MVAIASMLRLNVGCGDYALPDHAGWVNIDSSSDSKADHVEIVPPLVYGSESVDEIYAGHFLEHLDVPQREYFMAECYRVLRPGGLLGLLVPDTREIMRRYLGDMGDYGQSADGRVFRVNDLDDVCAYWLFSTVQPSHHKWAYDLQSLRRLMERWGFEVTGEINRHTDSRLSTPQWYQCGLDARKI